MEQLESNYDKDVLPLSRNLQANGDKFSGTPCMYLVAGTGALRAEILTLKAQICLHVHARVLAFWAKGNSGSASK